jgi:iron complex transport system substrate-binding protein
LTDERHEFSAAGGMEMRWKIFAILMLCVTPMIGSAFAQGMNVPGDSNGDKVVSAEEVEAAEKLAQEGKLSADELEEIRHIHEKYPFTIIDSANRTVTIYKPVKRMIIQPTFEYEPVFILGVQDRLAAVTTTAQKCFFYMPGIKDKPAVGEYKEIDYESVIENQPDIYILGSNKTLDDVENKLNPIGTTVIVMDLSSLDAFKDSFRTLAKLMEEEDRAEEFLSWWESYLNDIKEKTDKIEPKRKVYNDYANELPWSTGARTSGIDDAITLAGGFNIARNLDKLYYAQVDPEWVLQQNPEVIIIPAFHDYDPSGDYLTGYQLENGDNAERFIEEASQWDEWKQLEAVKNGQVYVLDGDTGFTSCKAVIAATYMAKWFYPERFKDLDPEVVHKEYFEEWLGVPYRGIWAYPQVS